MNWAFLSVQQQFDHAVGVRAAVDVVTDEQTAPTGRDGSLREDRLQRAEHSVDVADDPTHGFLAAECTGESVSAEPRSAGSVMQ